ncbi:ORC1-type DNA replication protein [Methanospirillum sp. J.3.6.1-F.2.7.3]|jgi:cell division control protein 6|uniref:ORC1-type DNA replication protein n=1 Tax=Methanospirillum purgamenti TaxID=2834276 RepID=A0A8E7AZL9_9EURY|nr:MULTISPECIES: ORC1-type DNA replication protein [Methanospirillum]MDX8550423.1 ORC1-type DNA replication protein [Methanospirillum hungatei]QVV88119.1 ORC1-type DNA replication protein [Methanospirillum sp. J.3.6.1-F.2.7.3]
MTLKNMLMWDETLFRDPDIFEIDYIPDQFNYRENQLRELAFLLKPGLKGSRPLNAIIKGTPGTGKTTSVKKIFAEIGEIKSKMLTVHINCQIENSRFMILSQIYRQIAGHNPSAAGNSYKRVFESIAETLLEEDRVLLIALDDANYLLFENELNNVLYLLLRAHETYPGTRIGVMVIISDMDVDLSRELDIRVTSVFSPTEVYFPPYSVQETFQILKERVQQGLYPGVLSDSLLDLVVDHTLRSGDMRVGIDMIKRATLNAEKEAKREISHEHIQEAYKISRFLHLKYSIQALRREEKDVLRILVELSRNDEQLTSGKVYTVIKKKLKLGYTVYYEALRKLDSLRLLNLQFRDGRGRTRLINLRYDPDKILQYL